MYIELWQFGMVASAVISAFFSYRQGRLEGIRNGVQVTLSDLHSRGIVAINQDDLSGEMIVGRYDENDWSEPGEDYDEEDEHW